MVLRVTAVVADIATRQDAAQHAFDVLGQLQSDRVRSRTKASAALRLRARSAPPCGLQDGSPGSPDRVVTGGVSAHHASSHVADARGDVFWERNTWPPIYGEPLPRGPFRVPEL